LKGEKMNSSFVELGIKIVFAVILVVWFYKDARARDFSWLFWASAPVFVIFVPTAVAILFFIALFFLYLAMRPKGNLFKCPHCNKPVYEELFVCPFCRKNTKKECLNCHEPVPWEAEQCPHCRSRALTKE
jgi:RNA polymerase subunit RPABC4/transcription elongation factor Spt4